MNDNFFYIPDKKVKIIFDTDMDTDVDDTGALAVLYSYVQEGRAEVLATVGSCNSGCAVKCIGGINAYYGFPEVPVGISPHCPSSGKSPYQSVIAEKYGKDYPDDKSARPALEVYREVLSSAEDNSVVITVIGALNNLCDLLKSESDKYSPLNGTDLVRQKAKLCIIMGGRFPKSAPVGEYNIRLDVDAAYYVVHNCPASILWSGQEIGGSIFTGNMRNEMEEDNPVRLAYNLYGNDETGTYTRESWDLTTIVYAVEGAGDYWDIQTGFIEINTEEKILVPDYGPAYNNWTVGEGKDAILIQKMNPEKIAEMLNKRMVMAKKLYEEGDNLNMDEENVYHRLYTTINRNYINDCIWDYNSKEKLSVKEIENGIIEPIKVDSNRPSYLVGGVCDSDFNFIASFRDKINTKGGSPSGWFGIGKSYPVEKNEIAHHDETVMYGGVLYGHIGHLITECLAARLWWYEKNRDNKVKVAFIIWGETIYGKEVLYNMLNEFFELLEIPNEDIIFIDKPTSFKKIIVPEECVNMGAKYYTDEYALIYDRIRKNVAPANYEKIYLTRAKYQFNKITHLNINEEYFEEFYKKQGFDIISMEQYSVKEKISIMMGANEVVAPYGTNTHFAIFCDCNTKLTCLTAVSDYTKHTYQYLINHYNSLNYYIVDISLNFLCEDHARGSCIVGPTECWKKYVLDMYGQEINENTEDWLRKGCYDYIKSWCELYSYPSNYSKFANIDNFEILNKIYKVFFGSTLDCEKLNVGNAKVELKKQVHDLNAQKNDLTSKINALTKENEGYKSSKATLEDENKRLNAQLKSISDMNEALKLQLTALENTNKTLMSANSHLAQSVTEISSLLKNNTDSGE